MLLKGVTKYPMPDFLKGTSTDRNYSQWINSKADSLRRLDIKRKRPYAMTATDAEYAQLIHNAVLDNGQYDPYTGDKLAWKRINTWDPTKRHGPDYKKKFALMPTVDHTRPAKIKSDLTLMFHETSPIGEVGMPGGMDNAMLTSPCL